ncbi:MAG: hypothetical protein KJ824_03955 [Alphaproteobacteria bacterium]|nr:hypothetical protein [Alphaproteobacteria bacterium]
MEKRHRPQAALRDPGPGRDRFERGYCVLSKRTWERIRIEFGGGASVAWLSARYGAAERTIANHAKAGGWRRKDLALKADAVWDAEDEAEAVARTRAAEVAGTQGAAREAASGVGADEVDLPTLDLVAAAREARASAVAVGMKHPRLAQDYLKLAEMLDGAGLDGEAGDRPSPQDQAALAAILEKLGGARDVGV